MNAPVSLSSANERADQMITRARQARSIISLLSFSIQDEDCPPTQETVIDVLAAVETILEG